MDIERLKGATCPDCNGGGVYQEYDEFDRYAVHSCATCDGSGEIARQSATSEEVQRAIEQLKYAREQDREFDDGTFVDSLDLAITALQAYQPWIPVSNIKPEKSGRYIAYVPEHWTADSHKEGKVIIACFRELNYEGKRRAWDDGAYAISGEVTHYLPLPESPKGETP